MLLQVYLSGHSPRTCDQCPLSQVSIQPNMHFTHWYFWVPPNPQQSCDSVVTKYQTKNRIIDRNVEKDLPLLTGHLVTAPTNFTSHGEWSLKASYCRVLFYESQISNLLYCWQQRLFKILVKMWFCRTLDNCPWSAENF